MTNPHAAYLFDSFTVDFYDCGLDPVIVPSNSDFDLIVNEIGYLSLSQTDFATDSRCNNYTLSLEVKQSDGSWLLMHN